MLLTTDVSHCYAAEKKNEQMSRFISIEDTNFNFCFTKHADTRGDY